MGREKSLWSGIPPGRYPAPVPDGPTGIFPASAALLVAAALAVGCGGDDTGVPTPSEVPAGAVAVVGSEPVTRQQFRRNLRTRLTGISPLAETAGSSEVIDPPRFGKCQARLRRSGTEGGRTQLLETCRSQYEGLKLSIVTKLIEDQWVLQSARAEGIEVTPEEVDGLLAQYRSQPGDFGRKLKRSGLTVGDLRLDLEAKIARQKGFERRVEEAGDPSADEIREFYEDNPGIFGKAAARTAEVLATDSEDFAEKALGQAEAGRSLTAISRKASTGLEVRSGEGVVTIEEGRDVLPEDVEEAIFEAPEGELTGPVESNGNWYVFRVTGIREADVPPFGEVEEEAASQARSAAISRIQNEALNQLRRDWRPKTLCAERFLVPQCSNGPELPDLPSPDSL